MRDQPAVLASYDIGAAKSITDHLFAPSGGGRLRAATVLSFLLRGRGALTSPGCDHGAFVSTGAASYSGKEGSKGKGGGGGGGGGSSTSGEAAPLPDCQLRFVPGRGDSADGVRSYENLGKGGHCASGVTLQVLW